MSGREKVLDPEQIDRLRTMFAATTSVDASDADSSEASEPGEPGEPSEASEASEPGDPIDPERIWAAARGELDPIETAALVDRLHLDPELAIEWRLALELSAANAEPTPIRAAAPRRYWVAGALMLATAAAVSVVVLQDDGSTGLDVDTVTPGLRAPKTSPGEAALSTPVADGSTVARTGFELRWSAPAGASRYELQVRTEALDPVFEANELQSAHALVPAELLTSLEPGRILIWQVTAVMADGARERGPAWRVVLE